MDTIIHPGLNLLQKLMMAAGWHSSHRNLTEAAPHLADSMSANDLIATLDNLDIPTSVALAKQSDIRANDCPALFVDASGKVTAVLGVEGGKLLLSSTEANDPIWCAPSDVRGTVVKIERFAQSENLQTFENFRMITAGFRGLIPWLVGASFMTNLMGLATPLLIMMIYDRVIPSGSSSLVISLAFGVVLVLAADAGFRYARSSAVAYMGRVVEHRLGLALFRKLLCLPPDQIQKSDVEQQIARFKQFEGMRDIFAGQVLTTLLDLPFILVFLGIIFALAPPVGFLVLGLIAVFVLAIWVTLPVQQSLNTQAATIKSKQQKYLFETVSQQRNLYRLGLGDFWRKRYTAVAQESASASRKARRFQHVCQSFGQSLMMIAGVGAIVLGTLAAMAGTMSFGALIAVMALVWKVLTPLQSLYSNAPQILGFFKSRQQVDRVLAMPQEMVRGAASSHQKEFDGRITLAGVTHRFAETTVPALSQVSLDIAAGEFVVIAGSNGSGKTTLLEVMMGLHQPIVGSVQLDGIDVRQIPVDDLRQSFSYAQKKPEVFHGTLLQNFRLAAPTAPLEDIEAIVAAFGLEQEVQGFPEGLNTRLTENYRKTLSSATSRGLALARSFIRPAAVYLLNEPNAGLDYLRRASLIRFLDGLKSQRTIIVVSDDPEYIQMADRCIFMAEGRIVANDVGKDGQRKITALIAANKES